MRKIVIKKCDLVETPKSILDLLDTLCGMTGTVSSEDISKLEYTFYIPESIMVKVLRSILPDD